MLPTALVALLLLGCRSDRTAGPKDPPFVECPGVLVHDTLTLVVGGQVYQEIIWRCNLRAKPRATP